MMPDNTRILRNRSNDSSVEMSISFGLGLTPDRLSHIHIPLADIRKLRVPETKFPFLIWLKEGLGLSKPA